MNNLHTPLVSIVMACHNEDQYIEEAINSILNQSYSNIELVIIIDGSKDKSAQIIKRLATRDKRIEVFENRTNMGLTKSLNRGIKRANGEYIARQDANDSSQPKRIEKQVTFMERNPEIFLCATGILKIDEQGKVISISTPPTEPDIIEEKLEKTNCIAHSSILFRNEQVLYREKFYYAQDYDLYLRLLSNKKKIAVISEPLVRFRYSDKSISSSRRKIQLRFAKKALEFYHQRLRSGKDNYDKLNIQSTLKTSEDQKSQHAIEGRILYNTQTFQYTQLRKELTDYFLTTKKISLFLISLYFYLIIPVKKYRLYKIGFSYWRNRINNKI